MGEKSLQASSILDASALRERFYVICGLGKLPPSIFASHSVSARGGGDQESQSQRHGLTTHTAKLLHPLTRNRKELCLVGEKSEHGKADGPYEQRELRKLQEAMPGTTNAAARKDARGSAAGCPQTMKNRT